MRFFAALFLFLLLIVFPNLSQAGTFQISGGVDGRYVNTAGKENNATLEGLFLNFRKTFSDNKGDRLIAVAQLDADHDFEKVRPYQTCLQYKGPLGRWNLRAGHYILPFGLLSDYDTERLVLRTLEPLSLGIKLDTGVEPLGYLGNFDYAVSVSEGVGRNRLADVDDDKVVTTRIGWQGEDINIGLSTLIGRVLTEKDSVISDDLGSNRFYEKRMGLDATKYAGPLVLRGEILFGEDNDTKVGGALFKADYALMPKWELNLKTGNFNPKHFWINSWEKQQRILWKISQRRKTPLPNKRSYWV